MPKILVTKEDWLSEGICRFGERGLQGIVVEDMAKRLGCAKSSFYWYFDSRKEYLSRLVSHWVKLDTDSYIESAEREAAPGARIFRLFTEIAQGRGTGDFLFHLRNLSRKNRALQTELAAVEERRMGYVAGLLGELGHAPEEASRKSDLLYSYYLGWYERNKHRAVPPVEIKKTLATLSRIVEIENPKGVRS